jgi:hypothetical protein
MLPLRVNPSLSEKHKAVLAAFVFAGRRGSFNSTQILCVCPAVLHLILCTGPESKFRNKVFGPGARYTTSQITTLCHTLAHFGYLRYGPTEKHVCEVGKKRETVEYDRYTFFLTVSGFYAVMAFADIDGLEPMPVPSKTQKRRGRTWADRMNYYGLMDSAESSFIAFTGIEVDREKLARIVKRA